MPTKHKDSVTELFKEIKALREEMSDLKRRLDRAEDEAAHWKKRYFCMEKFAYQLQGELSLKNVEIRELKKIVAKQDVEIAWLKKQVFGRKTETSAQAITVPASDNERQGRGKQPGSKGYGRQKRLELSAIDIIHDIPDSEKVCQCCGRRLELLPFTEDSQEIDCQVEVRRLVHRRLKYRRTCKCKETTVVKTAPPPPKLIPKGGYTSSFWSFVLIDKFLLYRPLTRTCQFFGLYGCQISDGVLANGLRRLEPLLLPLYNDLIEMVRGSPHWHMDETHWKNFADEDKENHQWWLWVNSTESATVFILDPTRAGSVPQSLLYGIPTGFLSCDRYSAYKSLPEGIQLSFCWAHVRRDFIKLRDSSSDSAALAQSFVERINDLFELNAIRCAATSDSAQFQKTDSKLRKLLRSLKSKCSSALLKIDEEQERKPFESLLKHWEGLTLFVEHPMLPMDNNESERLLRGPVVLRKNSYGTWSNWGGQLTVTCLSLFATLRKYKQDPLTYLTAYFNACAVNGGRPPKDLTPFLPWRR